MARMDTLPADAEPELAATFATFERILGVVPNSLLTMQRRPRIVAAFEALTEAVMDPDGVVDMGLKRLAAHMASRAAGCQYCQGPLPGRGRHQWRERGEGRRHLGLPNESAL